MSAIIGKLVDIEATAEAIVEHAEDQKKEIEQRIQKQRDDFDRRIAEETEQKISVIRAEAQEKRDRVLGEQKTKNRETLDGLDQEFKKMHTEYAKEILKRITEV